MLNLRVILVAGLLVGGAVRGETVADWHLLEPLWKSDTTYRESVMFLQEDGATVATAHLMFDAKSIVRVTSADQQTTYEAGRDFKLVNGHELVRLSNSKIPFRAIVTKPKPVLLSGENDFFQKLQLEVTYTHAPVKWAGAVPVLAERVLPRTMAKLKRREEITISVSGDSISQGFNASGVVKVPPFMPAYPGLVAAQLEAATGSKVTLHNFAVSGMRSESGLTGVGKLIESKPDLIVIAYGMNDVPVNQVKTYGKNIAGMLEAIRKALPETEVILVAPMLGNPDWDQTPSARFGEHRDVLAGLTGPGVALADMTSIWQELLKRKRYYEVTGNGLNHPNDFGQRLYAQAILALLLPVK